MDDKLLKSLNLDMLEIDDEELIERMIICLDKAKEILDKKYEGFNYYTSERTDIAVALFNAGYGGCERAGE